MTKKKKNKKDKFGWSEPKSYNSPTDSHGDKSSSDKYSFKIPGKAKPSKLWCSPQSVGSPIKRSGREGRPYGYKPLYDQIDTYNYQSESARFSKAVQRRPDLTVAKLYFYRASDDCYFHVVIPPDFTYEDLIENLDRIPIEFFNITPDEFWRNFPVPQNPTPGQPLFPNRGRQFPIEIRRLGGTLDYELDPTILDWGGRVPRFGCTNPEAENYDPLAQIDDGSCILPNRGCTDPEADNYDPEATYDDGSCQYTEEEEPNPNGPCYPPLCYIGPQYEGRWVVVSKEQALAGQGCPVGYTNNGYAELPGGVYQVLCSYEAAQAEYVERLWYRYPGGNWVKVESDAGELYSWYVDPWFYVADAEGMLVAIEGVKPLVYLGCDRPGDTEQAIDPEKIQDDECPIPWLGEIKILMEGPDGFYVGGDREVPELICGFDSVELNLDLIQLRGIKTTGVEQSEWIACGWGREPITNNLYALFYDSTGLLKKELIRGPNEGTALIQSNGNILVSSALYTDPIDPLIEYTIYRWVMANSSGSFNDLDETYLGRHGYLLPNVLAGDYLDQNAFETYRAGIGATCIQCNNAVIYGNDPFNVPVGNPWLVSSAGTFTRLSVDLNDALVRSDLIGYELYVKDKVYNIDEFGSSFTAEGWTDVVVSHYTISLDGTVTENLPTTVQVYEPDPGLYTPIDASYFPYLLIEEEPPLP